MKIHMLDMGDEKYGDCIVCMAGDHTLIVDGGHAGDIRKRGDTPSIPQQLAQVFGKRAPFQISLLVVTHCHADHIGCLPDLVSQGVLEIENALVADETWGFGHIGTKANANAGGPSRDDLPMVEQLVAAMREEPRPTLRDDDEIAEFIADAAALEPRYLDMLERLEKAGTQIYRYGRDNLDKLHRDFAGIGLKVLGPSEDQLKLCAEAIASLSRETRRRVRDALASNSPPADAVALYRSLVGTATGPQDRPGKGAAINDTSVIVKVGTPNDGAALLTGDMQFAMPEMAEVSEDMQSLRSAVIAEGPYVFVKLAHHASYNGLDESLLDRLGCRALGMSGGRGDPGHPSDQVLKILRAKTDSIEWARTDKNGLFTCTVENNRHEWALTEGKLNDDTPNSAQDTVTAPEVITRRVPGQQLARGAGGDSVEVTARVPYETTRVTITVDVEPSSGSRETARTRVLSGKGPPPDTKHTPLPSNATTGLRLGGGRSLPKLLFVTQTDRLAANIGRSEATQALDTVKAAGQTVHNVADVDDPYTEVAAASAGYAGIVIIGGYDVLPAARLDTLDPDLRRLVGTSNDADDFIVWSDAPYGDQDKDGVPELPISRIPDGRKADLIFAALGASPAAAFPSSNARFGLRNVHRPFADQVYRGIAGATAMLVSQPTKSGMIQSPAVASRNVYFMLHGSDLDTSRFWGELANGSPLEAFRAASVPSYSENVRPSVVLSGCCWGALTVRTKAVDYTDGDPLQVVAPESSVALSFLAGGALAFVGCTGSHYSPQNGATYFGGPMHTAYWAAIGAGKAPALALQEAKRQYVLGMPHGLTDPVQRAIEFKILRQFTCLGLGW